jgi:hypothetical protein
VERAFRALGRFSEITAMVPVCGAAMLEILMEEDKAL